LIIANKNSIFSEQDGQKQIAAPDKIFLGRNNDLFDLAENKDIQEVILKYRQQTVYEALCVLYVAITRAKHAIYLYTAKDKETLSLGNILKNALWEWEDKEKTRQVVDGENIKRHVWGYADWKTESELQQAAVVKCQELSNIKSHHNVAEENTFSQLPSNMGIRTKNLQIISPSSLAVQNKVNNTVNTCDTAHATDYGSIMHLFLEQIEWLEDFKLTTAELLEKAKNWGNIYDKARNQELILTVCNDFFAYIKSDEGLKLFSNEERKKETGFKNAKVYNELPIMYLNEKKSELIKGRIDRCVVYFNETIAKPELVEIFDYKTNTALTPEDKQEKNKIYQPQLDCYKEALSKLTNQEKTNCKIEAKLVFI
jgi:ATP-dependent exoDNAse (exonuclease V) beta subunit